MKRCLEGDDLLDTYIREDVWTIILPLLSLVDILVMCHVSKKKREIFKEFLRDGFVLHGMVACRNCGHLDWSHFCDRASKWSPCMTGREISAIENKRGNIYALDIEPILALNCRGIEKGVVHVIVTLKNLIPPNWGRGHTIGVFELELFINSTNDRNRVYYSYDGELFEANRFIDAKIVSK